MLSWLTRRLGRVDFWSIRDPEGHRTTFQRTPDGLKGYELLGALSQGDSNISSSIESIRYMLFDRRKDAHFQVTSTNEELKRLVVSELLGRRSFTANRFEMGVDSFEDLLSLEGTRLMIHGRAYLKLDWRDKDGRISLAHVRSINPGNLRKGRRRKNPNYQWTHRENPYMPDSKPIVDVVSADEVVEFVWMLDGVKRAGRSPLTGLTRAYREGRQFWTRQVAYAYAHSRPDDNRFWVDRARHIDLQADMSRERRRQLTISRSLGTLPQIIDLPVTEYYDTYLVLKVHKRLSLLREYLIGVVNTQIVQRLAQKNGFEEPVQLATRDYLLPDEITDLQARFENRELSATEVSGALRIQPIQSTSPENLGL